MRRAVSFFLILVLSLIATAGLHTEASSVSEVEQYVLHLKLKPESLRAIADKQVVVRGLSTKNDKEIAAFGVVMADAPPDAFVESYRTLATFQQNPCILASGKFSAKPTITDLEGLTLDDDDLLDLVKPKAGDSGIKLSDVEMAKFHQLNPTASRLTPQMKMRITAEFKRMLVERAKNYLTSGAAGLGIYTDKEQPVNGQDAFVSLAREQSEGSQTCSHLFAHLESFPQNAPPESESFIYWAKQKFGDLKPVINVVHVFIHRDGGRVYLASKQIYSTHYTEAGLTVAELIPFEDADGASHTVVIYTLRVQVDMLGGTLGFMKKRMAQPKVLATLKQSLNGMRTTMENLNRASAQAQK